MSSEYSRFEVNTTVKAPNRKLMASDMRAVRGEGTRTAARSGSPDRNRCLLISDFNIETFRAHLESSEDLPNVEATAAPYGQVVSILREIPAAFRDPPAGCAVIWTQPENIIPSYASLLRHETASVGNILEEVDAFADQILNFQRFVSTVFVPTWLLPPHAGGYGMLAMRTGFGPANMLMRMNLELAERFEKAPGIHLLDAQRWMLRGAPGAFNQKLWYLCKVPFGHEVFRAAARDIKAALRGVAGEARKLIILDLDNTIWGGTVGEVEWHELNLGGHHALGEAYSDFQSALKALTRRGIILGICSKNTESVALDAMRNHPEMILTPDDFAGWRINWRDKGDNIVDLVHELGLGLQSAVFIDDSPAERARVRNALPDVAVPEWPRSPMLYTDTLLNLPYFDFPCLSTEDLERSGMYAAERRRREAHCVAESAEDWLRSLEICVRISELNEASTPRVVQLLNKTNQMNLSTRRLTEEELRTWMTAGARKLWTFRVADRFGDQGLCGILSLEVTKGTARIIDFVLSCRVIGRKVEETMLHRAIAYAGSAGLGIVSAEYVPTLRNEPCRIFLERSGMAGEGKAGQYRWKAQRPYPLPDAVTIEIE